MEPITIAIVGVLLVVRYGITDGIAAAKGTEPARLQARRERHERAMARGPGVGSAMAARVASWLEPASPGKEPGAARRWFAAVWRDAFEHAGEVHVRRVEQRKAGELPRQRAWRAARRGAEAAGRAIRDRIGQRRPIRMDAERLDRETCLDCGRVRAAHCDECGACEPTAACRRSECVETGEVVDDPEPARSAEPAADPVPTPEPHHGATVTPIRPEGAPDMTTANLNGETYNPEAGQAFAQGVKANQEGLAASCETSQSSLAGHVEGEALALIASIAEHASAAASDAEKLDGIFAKQREAADVAAAAGVTEKGYLHA